MVQSPFQSKDTFDDFLNLKHRCFAFTQLLLLVGVSGSGKSTTMQYLADAHPSFCREETTWLRGLPVPWSEAANAVGTLFVDEVRSLADVTQVLRLVATGRKLVVASHIPLPFFLPARAWGTVTHLRTDSCAQKLARYLHRRGIRHTPESLARYVRKFGANYIDLEIILDRNPSCDFDHALRRFERFDRLSV